MQAVDHHVILIVEDEALIRMIAVEFLMDSGHEVVEAENADEAVRILEARSDITVVFTDIDMPPGMNGISLAAAVRDRWPPIRIIATSGRVRIGDEDLPSGSRFLPKPYTAAAFSRTLDEITLASSD